MRSSVVDLVTAASSSGRAVAAFNVYAVHQAAGVVDGARRACAPVILQVHPGGLGELLPVLLAALVRMRDDADIDVAICLDHTADLDLVRFAADAGVDAVMVDGSAETSTDNAALVAAGRRLMPPTVAIEAELGRLSGTEDGSRPAVGHLTDPDGVAKFVATSGADLLAVSVGNVHGATPEPPTIDLVRLDRIGRVSTVPLVLHGASGLPPAVVREAIRRGVAKINVNTEIRGVYRDALRTSEPELGKALRGARGAVANAVERIIRAFATG